MAGMIATPALGEWPQEYVVQPEAPAKRAKPCGPYVYHSYFSGAMAYAPARKRIAAVGPTYGAPVPTPPPSISVLHNTHNGWDGAVPSPDLDAPIQTKGGAGPCASHFCGAVTFLWFSIWPTAKAYLCSRELAQEIHEECRARPEFVKYTRSLIEKADVSIEILTLALLFLYRFRDVRSKRASAAPLDRHPTSEARVLVVALMTANKLLDDISYTTVTWSKMSGIDLKELKRMETEFLVGLQFNLHVSAKQWAAWEQLVPSVLYPAVAALGCAGSTAILA